MSSILIKNIKTMYGIQTQPLSFKKGAAMSVVDTLENAFILTDNGKIVDFGPVKEAPERADEIVDASDRLVMPCWCDSHTHIVYAAPREGEYVDRLHGASYEEIAEKGGGILNSARKMQESSEEDLFLSAGSRLNEVISYGTGAIEIKSGYGLTTESELKMLRVIR
ncbi:MAG: imidazolonepropionase, partial [Saprospiraceae bacterium]